MMNERIKELMIEAFQSHYGDPVTPVAREKAVVLVSGWGEKFAELMVRECAEVCLAQRDPANLNYKPSVKFAEAVKEHFGVKR